MLSERLQSSAFEYQVECIGFWVSGFEIRDSRMQRSFHMISISHISTQESPQYGLFSSKQLPTAYLDYLSIIILLVVF